jgi:hypothetical protein
LNITRVFALVAALSSLVSAADAWGRPGTPNPVNVDPCFRRYLGLPAGNLGLPALCVTFRNTATQEVRFDIEMSGKGRLGRPSDSRVDCLIPADAGPVFPYQCTAGYNLMGSRVTTRAAPSDWLAVLNAVAVTPFVDAGMPLVQDLYRRLAETDPEWQGFYVADLDWDTEYCFRIRARDTSDTVSEMWSRWECERTPLVPPVPSAPEVKVEYNELRGTLYATWGEIRRVGYYTVEGRASLDKYSAEVARLIPAAARQPSNATPFRDARLELAVPYGLAKAMDGEAYLLRVCAHNISGKACSDWASNLGTSLPGSIANASVREGDGVADARPPPDPAAARATDLGGVAGAVPAPPDAAAASATEARSDGAAAKPRPIRRDVSVATQP